MRYPVFSAPAGSVARVETMLAIALWVNRSGRDSCSEYPSLASTAAYSDAMLSYSITWPFAAVVLVRNVFVVPPDVETAVSSSLSADSRKNARHPPCHENDEPSSFLR